MRNSRLRRTLAVAASAAALALSGTLVTATDAAAVGSSACNHNVKNHQDHITKNHTVIRSGPGTSYSQRNKLSKGDPFYVYCRGTSKSGHHWYYGDYMSQMAWVYSGNI